MKWLIIDVLCYHRVHDDVSDLLHKDIKDLIKSTSISQKENAYSKYHLQDCTASNIGEKP